MEGKTLIDTLLDCSGIRTKSLENEFHRLIEHSEKNASSLGLDDLREILASYLQDVILEAKEHTSDSGANEEALTPVLSQI
ncbi:MAG: hypothetical protein CL676_04780 [Bdellovibrionaceae bacterium]|nr:hypothetical protein [Pseudobdellovibrionaceae bacterium]|tara:strand:+ start:1000 stop:1242 length:243 start_codon:yes stop_codon:yes gene_type:complete